MRSVFTTHLPLNQSYKFAFGDWGLRRVLQNEDDPQEKAFMLLAKRGIGA